MNWLPLPFAMRYRSYEQDKAAQEACKKALDKASSSIRSDHGFFIEYKLPDLLDDGETIQIMAEKHGAYGEKGLLIVTNLRLFFTKPHNTSVEDSKWDFDRIRSVEFDDKFFSGKSGKLTIHTTDNRSQVFEHLDKQAAKAVAGLISAHLARAASAPSAVELIGLLTKLADLRLQGLITPDEFEKQKRKLMGS